MSTCVPVFLFLEARRLLAVEDDSSDDERPRNRRRLDNRAYCSAAAVTGQPPALAAFGSQYLVWLAACCAHTPAMGSGYWSRPRTKDFSLLVHSTWEDAMFYSYFRFNRCPPSTTAAKPQHFSSPLLPLTQALCLLAEVLWRSLLWCHCWQHHVRHAREHAGHACEHTRLCESRTEALCSNATTPGHNRGCQLRVQDRRNALAGRDGNRGAVLTIGIH